MSIMKVARRSSMHVHDDTVAQSAANCPHDESAVFIAKRCGSAITRNAKC
jgi:hypothetical protein